MFNTHQPQQRRQSLPLDRIHEVVSRGMIQIINGLDLPLRKSGISFVDFSAKSILAAAYRQTELSDFGDEHFVDGLDELVTSFQTEADLNLAGKLNLHQELTRRLTNRLRIQQLLKDHPEIEAIRLSRPLFILGLPRTGTTLLYKLLMRDSTVRVPLLWELLRPAPLDDRQHKGIDPRIPAAQWLVRGQRLFMPAFEDIHPFAAYEPEECIFLLQNSLYYTVRGNVPSYVAWLRHHDMAPEYRSYKQALQVLDWQRSGQQWVLKTPFHLSALDALLAVFPDACIVQLHRDPKRVIPSWCSLLEQVHNGTSLRLNQHRIGQSSLDVWSESMARALEVRASANPAQFYDVYYENLVRDPVGETRRLYNYFGFAWNPDHEQPMRDWLVQDSQKRKRVHDYSLEEYGLSSSVVDERFQFYTRRFDIPSL